jgi:1-acyl-sn-glycerol-3-phosphate acyltransferase
VNDEVAGPSNAAPEAGGTTQPPGDVAPRPGRLRRVLAAAFWGFVNAVQLVYTALWTAGCITLALLALALTRSHPFALAFARRLWAPGILHGAFARLEVEGLDRLDWKQAHLLAANHQSQIDIAALFRTVPVPLRFVFKVELSAVPFVGWYAAAMGMIMVNRGASHKAVASMRRATDILRGGNTVACFPEGTRSRDGSIRPFKTGAFAMAIDAGADVVPVAIIGTGKVLPPEGFRVRPGVIRVRFGTPVPTTGLTSAQRGELAGRVRDEVVRLYEGS